MAARRARTHEVSPSIRRSKAQSGSGRRTVYRTNAHAGCGGEAAWDSAGSTARKRQVRDAGLQLWAFGWVLTGGLSGQNDRSSRFRSYGPPLREERLRSFRSRTNRPATMAARFVSNRPGRARRRGAGTWQPAPERRTACRRVNRRRRFWLSRFSRLSTMARAVTERVRFLPGGDGGVEIDPAIPGAAGA